MGFGVNYNSEYVKDNGSNMIWHPAAASTNLKVSIANGKDIFKRVRFCAL